MNSISLNPHAGGMHGMHGLNMSSSVAPGERRKGKWTYEEEAYATRLIRDFKAGILPLRDGASLRAYLADKLNCEPMRITKKFARTDCIGKVTFRPASLQVFPAELRAVATREAEDLRTRFLLREAQGSNWGSGMVPSPAAFVRAPAQQMYAPQQHMMHAPHAMHQHAMMQKKI